jgi:5'-deoxynucleotidase
MENHNMKTYKFFEFIARMGQIVRWSLMRNIKQEDLKQHSFDVAVLAHALATIRNVYFSGTLDPNMAAVYALYHDTAEVFTGDIPTPIKFFGGGVVKSIVNQLEGLAINKMVGSLPDKLQPIYRAVFTIPPLYKDVIKAADRIAALQKCQEELAFGNPEFAPASARLLEVLKSSDLPEVKYFMENFMSDRPMSLDELIEGNGAWLLEGGLE